MPAALLQDRLHSYIGTNWFKHLRRRFNDYITDTRPTAAIRVVFSFNDVTRGEWTAVDVDLLLPAGLDRLHLALRDYLIQPVCRAAVPFQGCVGVDARVANAALVSMGRADLIQSRMLLYARSGHGKAVGDELADLQHSCTL